MNIRWGILRCIFLGQLRVCRGLCKDESCNSGLCADFYGCVGDVQCMEDVEDGRPRYLSRSAIFHVFHVRSCRMIQEHLHPNQDLQQAGLGLSGRRWMRNQFPKKPTSSSQHKSHTSHPSSPSSHSHPALMGRYSAPLLQCKPSRYYGMTHIAFLPPDPTVHVAYLRYPWLGYCLYGESDDSK